jgi:hypothetical protein
VVVATGNDFTKAFSSVVVETYFALLRPDGLENSLY